MKKLTCLLLIAILAVSLVACGNEPATGDNSSEESTPVSTVSSEESTPVAESTPAAETSEDEGEDSLFPLTYTPKATAEFVKTEDNPDGTLALGYGGTVYDPKEEIVLEYCKAGDELYTAIHGASDWPAELDDVWEGYGYVAIANDENASRRTLAVGKYGEKHAPVVRDHENALYKSGFRCADEILHSPEEEGLKYVDYCMLVADGEVTIEKIAAAAYEALYLQTWLLIPADKQGVQVTANGKTYSVSDIIEELAA